MYVQVIDDVHGKTLISARSQNDMEIIKVAKVGELKLLKSFRSWHYSVVFDRSGYLYHGRVKELAEAARKAGLDF